MWRIFLMIYSTGSQLGGVRERRRRLFYPHPMHRDTWQSLKVYSIVTGGRRVCHHYLRWRPGILLIISQNTGQPLTHDYLVQNVNSAINENRCSAGSPRFIGLGVFMLQRASGHHNQTPQPVLTPNVSDLDFI